MVNAMKKDKEKVLDEVWTEERVKSFLNLEPAEGIEHDFHVLVSAYRNMRLENFTEFLAFFKQAGRNFQATSPEGETLLDILKQHRKGAPYREALEQYLL